TPIVFECFEVIAQVYPAQAIALARQGLLLLAQTVAVGRIGQVHPCLGVQVVPSAVAAVDLEDLEALVVRPLLELHRSVTGVAQSAQGAQSHSRYIGVVPADLKAANATVDGVSPQLLPGKVADQLAAAVYVCVQLVNRLVAPFNVVLDY